MVADINLDTKDLERSILGTIMMSRDYFYENEQTFAGGLFFENGRNKELFDHISEWYSTGKDFDDILFHADYFSKHPDGYTVSELRHFMSQSNSSNLTDYLHELQKRFKWNRLYTKIRKSLNRMSEVDNIDKVVPELLSDINEVQDLGIGSQRVGHVSESIQETLDAIYRARETPDGISGVNTGYQSLNGMTAGWQPTDQIVIAARPGVGKTTFVLNLVLNAAVAGFPVAVFSLEMSNDQLLMVFVSILTDIPVDKMRSGKLSQAEMDRVVASMDQFLKLPIFMFDNLWTLSEIVAQVRILSRKHGVRLVCYDYLQLIEDGRRGESANAVVTRISRTLKKTAKQNRVSNLVLSQLSRKLEDRADKRPILSDLRDSGAIEQDADIIGFLYRPEYYSQERGDTELIVRKNRHGRIGMIPYRCEERKYIEVYSM